MIAGEYPYDLHFQRKLLTLLVRKPQKVLDLIEPQYFGSPIHVEVARVIVEAYKKHGTKDFRLTRSSLVELVKPGLMNMDNDVLEAYRSEIKKIFKVELPDVSILVEHAKEFAKEQRFREALMLAEKHVTNHSYDGAFSVIDKAYSFANAKSASSSPVKWKDLPHPLDFPFEEVEWTIQDILPTDALIAVSGDEGTGKTLLMLHWARAISEGSDFLGRRAYPRKVLYLGLDVSKTTLQQYMQMMRWVPDDYFRFMANWTGENNQPPMLDKPADIARLYEIAEQFKPVMVFDTIRDFFEGEENSSTETKPIMDVGRKCRALGATPIFMTHPPKGGTSLIRGAGLVSQKVDIPYLVSKERRDRRELCVLTCPKKNRFGSTAFKLTMEMQFIPIPGRVSRVRFVERPSLEPRKGRRLEEDLESIVDYLQERPGASQQNIEKDLQMGDKKVKDLVSLGRNKGILRRFKGRGKTSSWYARSR